MMPKKQTSPELSAIAGKPTLTAERLREVIDYDPTSGAMTWRLRTANRVQVGREAGWLHDGYRTIKIDGHQHLAHRLAWLYVTGEWPTDQIDHINNVRNDNRFSNLRQADASLNAVNWPRHRNAVGAIRGIRATPNGKFRAVVGKGGRQIYLGTFGTVEEAVAVRRAAAIQLFGEFARFD